MLDASIGAVGAAIMGAVVSLLSLIISKENKTSEFRQAWIDSFRSDVAEAISSASLLNAFFSNNKYSEASPDFLTAWSRTSAAFARIELRLNVTEPDHEAMATLIRRAEMMIKSGSVGNYSRTVAEELQDEVVALSQRIMKYEWDRVRSGEASFVIAKWITAIAVGLLGLSRVVG